MSHCTPILSMSEINEFLKNTLKLELSQVEINVPDFSLLQRICQQFWLMTPYSTICYLNIPVNERRLPTSTEVKYTGLNNFGGLCYEKNVFVHWVLAGLGFDVRFILSKVYGAEHFNHVFNIVHCGGINYYVDHAILPPTAEVLISLNFENTVSGDYPSSLWAARFYKKKFDGRDGYYGAFRWDKNSSFPYWQLPCVEENWAKFIEFSLDYKSLEELERPMHEAYTKSDVALIINRLFCYRFTNKRLTLVRNTVVYHETENNERVDRTSTSPADLVKAIVDDFGDLYSESLVQKAVETYIEIGRPRFGTAADVGNPEADDGS